MANLEMAWRQIRRLDEIAAGKTVIHRFDPRVKLVVTFFYIVTVVSFSKYDLLGLLPLILYPVFLISMAELPLRYLLGRVLMVTPFVFFVGIFNPFFDHTPLLHVNGLVITGGWLSFIVLLAKFGFTVMAALILLATSGINEIGTALLSFRIPRVFVMQLLFMYRYLSVLMEETARSLRAYQLRRFEGRGIQRKAWGSLVGQLLLRTIDRAQRIYQAMLCRGFHGELHVLQRKKAGTGDVLYLISWLLFFILARWINIPVFLGRFFMGVR
ncbi:MAG: cobalt ECF transporter T component CbiQ [Firmicutes bacterium]|nr:cobalt ECF transporter T component CbiQ [Bacillota bacterium]